MAGTLIQQFLREEATPEIRALLLRALDGRQSDANRQRQEFEFNKFDVLIDFQAGTVKIDDDLDISAGGEETCSIEEFESLLRS